MGWYSSRGGLSRDVPVKKVSKNKSVNKHRQITVSSVEEKQTFIDLRKSKKKKS